MASDCGTLQVRTEGPGGAFLLWTERSGLLHTVPFGGLAGLGATGSAAGWGPAPPPPWRAAGRLGPGHARRHAVGAGALLCTTHHMRSAMRAKHTLASPMAKVSLASACTEVQLHESFRASPDSILRVCYIAL